MQTFSYALHTVSAQHLSLEISSVVRHTVFIFPLANASLGSACLAARWNSSSSVRRVPLALKIRAAIYEAGSRRLAFRYRAPAERNTKQRANADKHRQNWPLVAFAFSSPRTFPTNSGTAIVSRSPRFRGPSCHRPGRVWSSGSRTACFSARQAPAHNTWPIRPKNASGCLVWSAFEISAAESSDGTGVNARGDPRNYILSAPVYTGWHAVFA